MNRARAKMGKAMKNETKKKLISEDVNEKIWMSLASVFDQTFQKSLMHGANPCGGNGALVLIPSGEREVFAQKTIKN